jgi:hypothetical protein
MYYIKDLPCRPRLDRKEKHQQEKLIEEKKKSQLAISGEIFLPAFSYCIHKTPLRSMYIYVRHVPTF